MTRYASIDELPPELREQARSQMQPACIDLNPRCGDQPVVMSPVPPAQPKPRKYRNEPITVDGHIFASRWEAQRYRELRNQIDAGMIRDLRLQVEFGLDIAGPHGPKRVAAYVADFTYRRHSGYVTPPPFGDLVVEDCKSAATKKDKIFVLKRTMFEAQYEIRIIEIERKPRRPKP